MNFADKVVALTGSSKGFGKGLAEAFKHSGSKVVISSDDEIALTRTAKDLHVDSRLCDVKSYQEVSSLSEYVIRTYGRIDVWVNNAGIQIAPSNIEDVDLQKLRALMDTNFLGYFYGCKAVLPSMKKQGNGIIVNINSTAGLEGKPGLSAYVSSKFAINGLTQTLRRELQGTSLQVFGIFPGGMQTEIYHEKYPDYFNDYMDVDYAVQKTMSNFEADDPEYDFIIRRPKK